MYNLILEIEKKENKKFIYINNEILNKNLNDLNKYELINLFNDIIEINYLSYYFKNNMNENYINTYKLMFNNDNDLFFKIDMSLFKRNKYNNINQIRNNLIMIINHIINNNENIKKYYKF